MFKKTIAEFKQNDKKLVKYYFGDKLLIFITTSFFCTYSMFDYTFLNIIFIIFAIISSVYHLCFSKKISIQKSTAIAIDLFAFLLSALIFGLVFLVGRFFILDDYSKTTSSFLFLIYSLLIIIIDFF